MVRDEFSSKDPRVMNGDIAESGLLATRSTNVLYKRKEQMKRWEDSDTNKASDRSRQDSKRKVRFQDSDVYLSACISGDEQEVSELLAKGADINTTTVDGLTALHQAVIDRKLNMVKFLIEEGSDINAQDNEGWTPLHAAACCGHPEIVKFLIDKNADLNVTNSDKELPIDLAETEELRDILQKAYDLRNIDPDQCRDEEEETMVRDASDWLTKGVFLDRPHPRTGATALHVASAKGYIRVLNLLLQGGADVNGVDFDGWTALHGAAHWGERHACEVLAEKGADFEKKSIAGQTCFDVADDDMIPFLEELKAQQLEAQKENKPAATHMIPPASPLEVDSLGNAQRRKSSVTRMSTDEKTLMAKRDELNEVVEMQQLSPTPIVSLPVVPSAEVTVTEHIPVSPRLAATAPLPFVHPPPPPTKIAKVETTVRVSEPSPESPVGKSPSSRLGGKFEFGVATVKPTTVPQLPSWRLTGRVSATSTSPSANTPKPVPPPNLMPATVPQPNTPTTPASSITDTSPRPVFSPLRRVAPSNTWQRPANLLSSFMLSKTYSDSALGTQKSVEPPAIVESLRLDSSKPYALTTYQLRSFTPPQREEAEAERRARSKKQRETRRSTQGVTMEQLKSAEELISQKGKLESTSSSDKNVRTVEIDDFPAKTSPERTVTARACVVTDEQPTRDPMTAVARRVLVIDSDAQVPCSVSTERSRSESRESTPSSPMPWKSRVLESVDQVTPVTSSDPSSTTTPSASGVRRRSRILARDRRATGPLSGEDIDNGDDSDHERKDEPSTSRVVPPTSPTAVTRVTVSTNPPPRGTNASLSGYGNRYPGLTAGSDRNSSSLATSRTSSAGSLQSSSSEPEIVDYKKLYENEKVTSDGLRRTIDGLESQLANVKLTTSPIQNGVDKHSKGFISPTKTPSIMEDREKRSYERRIAELEEELKTMKQLREDNQRLKDENGALIRVISKLSK